MGEPEFTCLKPSSTARFSIRREPEKYAAEFEITSSQAKAGNSYES